MSEEEKLRKIANEEMKKAIMENLDSSLIFTYIQSLEKELNQEKEKNKELEKENKEIIDYSYKNDSLLDLYQKEKNKRIKYGNILFAHNLVENLDDFFEE